MAAIRQEEHPLGGELLAIATKIAHAGGRHALERVQQEGARQSLRTNATAKSSATDLVSAADRETEQIIVSRLADARPKDGILGEEGSKRPSSSGIDWIIDPIDGTTNFLYGHGSFAISLGAYEGDRGIAGVVFDPVRDETFSAIRGGGATRNGQALHAPFDAPPLEESLLGTGFHYLASRRLLQARLLVGVLPAVRDIRRQGAASLDICSVVCQRLDAYYEAELQPWDVAAGLIIASEAGYSHEYLDLGGELDRTLLLAHPDLIIPVRALLRKAASSIDANA
ncbi:MAG TPA: inositol monophosphatase family protein [Acidimicrobiales bacterium]|nr:inositol monophosphatase family protein [Acidimicrobiales bacterium]